MKIAFRDFLPAVTKSSLFFSDKLEPLSKTVGRVNAWLSSSGVQVITVETILLPTIEGEEAAKAVLENGGLFRSGALTEWGQVVRVWYAGPETSV